MCVEKETNDGGGKSSQRDQQTFAEFGTDMGPNEAPTRRLPGKKWYLLIAATEPDRRASVTKFWQNDGIQTSLEFPPDQDELSEKSLIVVLKDAAAGVFLALARVSRRQGPRIRIRRSMHKVCISQIKPSTHPRTLLSIRQSKVE
jgi:hypothetical protein